MNDNIFGEKKNKSSGRSEGQDKAGLFIEELINETVVIFGIGISFLFHLLIRKPLLCLLWLAVVLATVYLICHFKLHLHFLIYIAPELKGTSILFWIKKRTFATQYTTILLLLVSGVSLALGVKLRFTRTKYQKIFKAVGLTNKLGDCPALVKAKKLDSQRVELIFDAKSVGKARFEAAADDLETAFGRSIESFSHGTNQRFISMILTQKKLPSYVAFEELASQTKLEPYSFYIGRTLEGTVQQSVTDLPHMLIAGTTGAGKSSFFKQSLVGLLQSSPHLQMYLIDLKGGLEMVDFKDAPNVCVIKTMKDAVYILKKIKVEMNSRFNFLERNRLKAIDPERDQKDRIVVAVDEASVLYMKRAKEDPEQDSAFEARTITNDLSKLSRAAAIHLILATQKVTKETIDTGIQENISARMCFKMNTLQGSLIVLGNKDALDLPDTKGRGIWSLGNKALVIQAPYIGDMHIVEKCARLKAEFTKGIRSLFSPMLKTEEVTVSATDLSSLPSLDFSQNN